MMMKSLEQDKSPRAPACSVGARVFLCVCVCGSSRVGYDLSHCMTPNNKLKPISEESMRLPSPPHPTPIHPPYITPPADVSVTVVGIKRKLFISTISVTSGLFSPLNDS